jgi:hypothetical protein
MAKRTKQLPKFPCNDCSVDVLQIGDWYMAQPELWQDELGLGWKDNLCIACLEKRLGRPLRTEWWLDIYPASTLSTIRQWSLSDRLIELWKPKRRPAKKRAKKR